MDKYLDKSLSPNERAKDLLKKMSLDEKMAQVQCYFYRNGNLDYLDKNYKFGLGEVSCLEMRTLDTVDEAISLQHEIQKRVIKSSPHGIPAIFHMEGLCGLLVKDAVSFPSGIGRASSFNCELEYSVGEVVGRQAAAMGITHVFAPVLDVTRNPRFGRYGETYGEDSVLCSAMGVAYTNGIQEESDKSVMPESVAKHFVGSHENIAGMHTTTSDIPPRRLRENYAKPFQAAIDEAGLKGIMPCYNSLDGMPVSGSSSIINELLRNEMGFDGICVSDYGAIEKMVNEQKVCETEAEAGLLSMSAGMDVELHIVKCFGDNLKKLFESGKADIAILDTAVERVLETKFRTGIFDHPFALVGNDFDNAYYREDDKKISKKSALQSIVLLKNNGILPLNKNYKRIGVIGWHAGTIRSLFGGYTHMSMAEGLQAELATMAGVAEGGERPEHAKYKGSYITNETPFVETFENLAKHFYPDTKTLFEQIKTDFSGSEVVYSYGYDFVGDDESKHKKALALAKTCDVVILSLGGKHGTGVASSVGENVDGVNINLPPCQESFIEKVAKVCPNVIGVHFDARPISSDNADKYLSAIIEAWNPSEYGSEAVCEVLSGKFNPCGKLPVTIAYNAGQTPITYNSEHGSGYHRASGFGLKGYSDCLFTPRYPFGFGLTYTKFKIENLTVNKSSFAPDEKILISASVENVGHSDGAEVVQLYIEDEVASTVRPVKQLQGFARVELRVGEKKCVTFELPASQLAILDRNFKWKIEKGFFTVTIGNSSEDIANTSRFEISADKILESGKNRGYFAKIKIN